MKNTFYNIDGNTDVLIATLSSEDFQVLDSFGFSTLNIPNTAYKQQVGFMIAEGQRNNNFVTATLSNGTNVNIRGGQTNFGDSNFITISLIDNRTNQPLDPSAFIANLGSEKLDLFAPSDIVPDDFTYSNTGQIDDADSITPDDLPSLDDLAYEYFLFIGTKCDEPYDPVSVKTWLNANYADYGYSTGVYNLNQDSEAISNIIATDTRFCGDEIDVIADPPMPSLNGMAEEFYTDTTQNGGLNSNCDNIPTGAMAGEQYAGTFQVVGSGYFKLKVNTLPSLVTAIAEENPII